MENNDDMYDVLKCLKRTCEKYRGADPVPGRVLDFFFSTTVLIYHFSSSWFLLI